MKKSNTTKEETGESVILDRGITKRRGEGAAIERR